MNPLTSKIHLEHLQRQAYIYSNRKIHPYGPSEICCEQPPPIVVPIA